MTTVRRFDYLDALRGYAILSVIVVHASQYFGTDSSPAAAQFLSQGARGVQLFFVVSALTLSMSWFARNESSSAFYIRRLFRIAPMLWLAIAFFVALKGLGPRPYAPEGIAFRHIAMTALFLHGLAPDTITSVVPGSWSVADEAIFYAIFPILVPLLVKSNWKVFGLVTVAAIVGGAHLSRLLDHFSYLLPDRFQAVAGIYFDLWFFRQLPCFIFGIALFKLSREAPPPSVRTAKLLCAAAVVLLFTLPFLQGVKYVFMLGLQTTFGAVFALLIYSLMNWQSSPLVNRVMIWMGKISYSAYFVHFALIGLFPTPIRATGHLAADFLITFAGLLAATVVVSSMTYLTIERPLIALGNLVLTQRYSSRHTPNIRVAG